MGSRSANPFYWHKEFVILSRRFILWAKYKVNWGDCILELKRLINKIERLRLKMIQIKVGKYYSHPEVVAANQDLDVVLDKYQEMIKADKD